MILDPQAGVATSAPARTVMSGMLMTELPRRQSSAPTDDLPVETDTSNDSMFLLTAGLALTLQAGLFAASAPWAVLSWALICAGALVTLALLHRTAGSPGDEGDQMVARCALGGFGLAWSAGIIMVGVHLEPDAATLFGLGSLVSAGAFAFWAPAGLLNALLLVAPATLLSCGAHWLGQGAGMGFLPSLGIGAFAMTAAVVSARTASR